MRPTVCIVLFSLLSIVQSTHARDIYVSTSGRDSNPGTKRAPKATIAAAYDLLQDGSSDSILLKRGDVWGSNSQPHKTIHWSKSGPRISRNSEPMKLGAYGDSKQPRPKVDFGGNPGMTITPGFRKGDDKSIHNLTISDIYFIASDRIAAPMNAQKGVGGIQFIAVQFQGQNLPFRNMTIDNVKLEGWGNGIVSAQDIENLIVRNSIFYRIFNTPGTRGTHGVGIISGAQGFTLENNVFYLIQHPDLPLVSEISHFAHSAYIIAQATKVVTRRNICIKTTDGLRQRTGGVYERNVSIQNGLATNIGQSYGVTPTEGGVQSSIVDNLFLDCEGDVLIGNTRGGQFRGNLVLQKKDRSPCNVALVARNEVRGKGTNIGVHGMTFSSNYVVGNFRHNGSSNDQASYSRLNFRNNQLDQRPLPASITAFLRRHRLDSANGIDSLGQLLVNRDGPIDATDPLSAESIINYFRQTARMPALEP